MTSKSLSIGKIRAMQQTSNASGQFTILAIDHQDALRRVLNSDNPTSLSSDELTRFKLDVVETLQNDISGVLLDPVMGAPQAISRGLASRTGLLVELEKADYGMEPRPLEVAIDPAWSVAKIKRMGANGVKLFFYYNPRQADFAAKQEDAVSRVVADCQLHDIPLYAEPIMVIDGQQHDFTNLVIESAQRIAALGVDVLKLEFPVNINEQPDKATWLEPCQRLTNAIEIPWVLLSAGVDYETFCDEVEFGCQAGAAGFIAGRAVWGDACEITNRDQRRKWLHDEGRRRIRHLSEITARHGRSWQDYFTPVEIDTAWFKNYA